MGIRATYKTTIELPDSLLRRVKLLAVHRNQKLKDTIAKLLEIGMDVSADVETPLRAPNPVQLKGRGPLHIHEIESAINSGRDE